MAKAPPVDRFMITCQVEAVDMGPIIAQLTRMGLTSISFELISDIPRYARNVKPVDGMSSAQLLRVFVDEHPTFKAIEVCKYFEAHGRTKGSAYPQLSQLVEDKVLKQLGGGNYARADVKHIAPPAKKVNGKSGDGNSTRYTVPHSELILTFAAKHPTFRSMDVKKYFEKKGRPPGSVSTALHDLVESKQLKRVGDGEYALTAAAARANGNGTETAATEAAHG